MMDLQDRREYSVSLHGSAKDAHIAELEARVAELSEALRDLYEMTERYAFATRARIRARAALAGKQPQEGE